MKKLIILLIVAGGATSAFAQAPAVSNYSTDRDLSRWVIDINALGGGYTQKMDVVNTAPNYLNGVNVNTGNLGFKNGMAVGGDLQLGLFFGKNKHWGIGTGLLYLREWGDVTLGGYHAEYQSTDANGYTFRQLVTANNMDERIKTDNFNIPLFLKYKNRFSKHWGFTADAGLLFNLQMRNEYKTNASFDYEAIYKYTTNADGTPTAVYESSPTPANGDFLITKAQFTKNNPEGSVQDYFNTKRTQGYDVGLGITPDKKTGSVSYNTGSVGVMFQPSVNYFFSDHVALNIGGYILFQPFNNTTNSNYMLTNKTGEYNSALNTVSHAETYSYGGNIGLRFFLGKKAAPLAISYISQISPTICGMCDGSFALHGLDAGKTATVNYNVDGATTAKSYSAVVDTSGAVQIPALCAGSYTGINVAIGKRKANGTTVTLVAPPLRISSATSTNPTAKDVCDGSITLTVLNAAPHATLTYNFNGAPQTYDATIAPDKTIVLSALCEGSYTGFTVTSNKCTASLTTPATVTLTAPVPPPPAKPVEKVVDGVDGFAPILFDFNKAKIHSYSDPILDDAYKALKEDKRAYITVDGNTDAIGSSDYNKALSIKRAAAVKTYLKKKGINPARIKTVGLGKTDPVATNETEEGRQKNRRAVMHLENTK